MNIGQVRYFLITVHDFELYISRSILKLNWKRKTVMTVFIKLPHLFAQYNKDYGILFVAPLHFMKLLRIS